MLVALHPFAHLLAINLVLHLLAVVLVLSLEFDFHYNSNFIFSLNMLILCFLHIIGFS